MVNYLYGEFCVYEFDDVPQNRNVSGYGAKIPTPYMVGGIFENKELTRRLRRVYAICYSNCASYYVLVRGERRFIHDWRF